MTNRVLHYWSARNWALSLVAALLLAGFDFEGRLYNPGSSSDEAKLLEVDLPIIVWPKLSPDDAVVIKDQFNIFDPNPLADGADESKLNRTTEEPQPSLADQKGELRELIMASRRYELVAVISPREGVPYALIRETHLDTGVSKLERYKHGDELDGLKISIASLTSITLFATPKLLEREAVKTDFEPIVLMMYNRRL